MMDLMHESLPYKRCFLEETSIIVPEIDVALSIPINNNKISSLTPELPSRKRLWNKAKENNKAKKKEIPAIIHKIVPNVIKPLLLLRRLS